MQYDISIEQVKKDTTQREQQLQKIKKNIEALQINMAKKKLIGKPISNNKKMQPLKPELMQQRLESEQTIKSPINYQSNERQFAYNSTLFKNMNNQSQPIMQNGSAVSNFSSVSNINNLLNNRQEKEQRVAYVSSSPDQSNNLLLNIDKVLQKVQRSQKMPVKTLEKIIQNKAEKYNNSAVSNESFSVSKADIHYKEQSARAKIDGYKQMVRNLDLISEQKHKKEPSLGRSLMPEQQIENNSFQFIQNNYSKTLQVESSDLQQYQQKTHKNKPSGLSYQSDFPISQSYKLPPTPPSKPKVPKNAVERQKAKIKQSIQQYKRMEIQNSHQMLDKSQIDFQLSDEEDSQQQALKAKKRRELLKQKEQLQLQLKTIEEELKKLQEEP